MAGNEGGVFSSLLVFKRSVFQHPGSKAASAMKPPLITPDENGLPCPEAHWGFPDFGLP